MFVLVVISHLVTNDEPPQVVEGDASCVWRGKSAEGEWLHCTNLRLRHPTAKVVSEAGEDVPVIMKHCAYHTPMCR